MQRYADNEFVDESPMMLDEPVLPLVRPRRSTFDEELWAARGDAYALMAADDVELEHVLRRPNRARRAFVRLVGWVAVAGVLWAGWQVATFESARRAMIEWGTMGFGQEAHALGRNVQGVVETLQRP